jgi:hypothetical protein
LGCDAGAAVGGRTRTEVGGIWPKAAACIKTNAANALKMEPCLIFE